jgi:hypothetical protein
MEPGAHGYFAGGVGVLFGDIGVDRVVRLGDVENGPVVSDPPQPPVAQLGGGDPENATNARTASAGSKRSPSSDPGAGSHGTKKERRGRDSNPREGY